MSLDAMKEALDTVTLVRIGDRETVIELVRAQFERFRLAGKIEAIEECQRIFNGRAS